MKLKDMQEQTSQSATTEMPAGEPRRKTAPAFSLNIKEIIEIAIVKWYWFVISLVLTLTAAFVYLARTAPTYNGFAKMMFLGGDKKSSPGVDLSGVGIRPGGPDITNEMYVLQSPELMKAVVEKLGLNNNYYTKDGFRFVDLYKATPVIVTPADTISADYYKFNIKLDGNKNFVLSDFDAAPDVSVKGSIGETVQTPYGLFAVTASPWYNGNKYAGSEIIYAHTSTDQSARNYAGRIMSSNDANSSVITVELNDVSPARIYDVLSELTVAYKEHLAHEQRKEAISTADFITNRLAILEQDLGEVEGDISSFKSSHQLPNVEAASALYYGKSIENQSKAIELTSTLQMAMSVRRELENEGISTLLSNYAGLAEFGISSQIGEYNRMVLERNKLLSSGNESNPAIQDLTSTLTVLKGNMVRSLDKYIDALNMQLNVLNLSDSRASSELTKNPERERYLLSVERQQKVKEQLYLFLLQKREESELSQAYVKDTMRVLSEPLVSGAPISPQRINVILLAIAAGLLLPLGIIILREMLNSTVRNRKDLGMLSVPFVGEIPYGPGKKRRLPFIRKMRSANGKDVVVMEGSNNVINEAFRAIRTSIEFMTPDNDGKGHVITFTSANPGSGKTFVVMNLAKALALSGKKVVVVDLDMRKASLSKWGGHAEKGISNLLIGQCGLDDIIMKDIDGQGVDLMPVGIIPPNPVELLSRDKLGEMFDALRDKYDYVLVDSTPAEIVADARIISKYADMTLFIIRADMFDKDMLPTVEEFAATGRYRNMAILLNGTDPNALYRRKRYGYGYGYGYVRR